MIGFASASAFIGTLMIMLVIKVLYRVYVNNIQDAFEDPVDPIPSAFTPKPNS